MMRKKSLKREFNILFSLVSCIVLSILLSNQASAVAIGVDQAILRFDNVLRDGYAEDTIVVTTDADYAVPVTYETYGEIKDWMMIVPNSTEELVANDTSPLALRVIITPPGDVATGNYTGDLRLFLGIAKSPEGPIGTSIISAFTIKIRVMISGEEIVQCVAGGFDIQDTEIDFPLEFFATVKNQGNVRLKPSFTINVWDQRQTTLLLTKTFEADENILPTTEEKVREILTADLPIGQYWVDLQSIECGNTALRTFSIVERGGIIDKGEFIRIRNKLYADTGEVVPINSFFKNLGQRTVAAKFKGTVSLNDQLMEVLESEELNVLPGETINLQTFFQPEMAGRYFIAGRVIYNGKLTFEKSSTLNVNFRSPGITGDVVGIGGTGYLTIFIGLMIVIIALLILIKKRKRTRKFRF